MDADFSHDPAHLPQFLEAIEDYDVVLGSRYLHGRVTVVNWPIGRLLLSYFANVYARWVTGLPIADADRRLQVLPARGAGGHRRSTASRATATPSRSR
jgi:hypothetical protein